MPEIELSSDDEASDDEVTLIVLKRPPVTEKKIEEIEVFAPRNVFNMLPLPNCRWPRKTKSLCVLKAKDGWPMPRSNRAWSRFLHFPHLLLSLLSPIWNAVYVKFCSILGVYWNGRFGHHPPQGDIYRDMFKKCGWLCQQEHGLVLFHLSSVWVEGAKLDMSRTRSMLPVGTEVGRR